jgi:hypothetical protein
MEEGLILGFLEVSGERKVLHHILADGSAIVGDREFRRHQGGELQRNHGGRVTVWLMSAQAHGAIGRRRIGNVSLANAERSFPGGDSLSMRDTRCSKIGIFLLM